jgi:hypothetical protein
MFANWFSRPDRSRKPRRTYSAGQRSTRPRQFRFETLDERTVLSAMSLSCRHDSPNVEEPEVVEAAPVEQAARQTSADALISSVFNETPQGTDKTVFMSGSIYTFTMEDFGFSDTGNAPPDLFLAVMLTTLPTLGTMTHQGAGVAVGQFIPVADIIAGDLRFTTSGTELLSHTSFTFQVQDDGGTPDGGSDLDPTPNTFTLFFDNQSSNFVQGLYVDVLNRQPEAEGYAHWLDLLSTGTTRYEVASAIWRSPEHRGIQVDGYYDQFFNRVADAGGRQFWINQMLAGAREENVMAAFTVTTEYTLSHLTNDSFVTGLYQDILNRAPDAGGLTFWVNALATNQSRSLVALGLVDTPERHQLLVTSYYADFLNRLPDSNGNAFWTNLLNQNIYQDRDVAEALLSTLEYASISH